ncbi:MAG: DUF5618 family protein [Candidatus Fibromonas sp.]|jgi:hypothetical protein|nr:DUF5618 family protein [Candidatus Fibromonas sp.]
MSYAEAMRYFNNAKGLLKKAERDGRYFKDSKYVSSASGVAYKGVLVALDCWLSLKGVEVPKNASGKKNRKSIEFYRDNIAKLDKKLLKDLNGVYETLHLFGYYDGTLIVGIVNESFKIAGEIINRIKPSVRGVL